MQTPSWLATTATESRAPWTPVGPGASCFRDAAWDEWDPADAGAPNEIEGLGGSGSVGEPCGCPPSELPRRRSPVRIWCSAPSKSPVLLDKSSDAGLFVFALLLGLDPRWTQRLRLHRRNRALRQHVTPLDHGHRVLREPTAGACFRRRSPVHCPSRASSWLSQMEATLGCRYSFRPEQDSSLSLKGCSGL